MHRRNHQRFLFGDMLVPTFSVNLGSDVKEGHVVVGRFDGKYPSLACVSASDQVVIFSPHSRDDLKHQEVRHLNVNRAVTSMASGCLGPLRTISDAGTVEMCERDVLIVGTGTTVLAYDLEANSDLFFKEVPDGAVSVAVGSMSGLNHPVVMVGGNCSLQGYDMSGNEVFWTVAGDNVTALAFRNQNRATNVSQEPGELLVGCEDFDVRVLRNEDVVCETSESASVSGPEP